MDFNRVRRKGRSVIVLAMILAIDGVLSTEKIDGTRLGNVLKDLATSPLQLYGSPRCFNHSEIYLNELKKFTPWALKSK